MLRKNQPPLPKIGDRVEFDGQRYLVVDVDEETQSASLVLESEAEIETIPLDKIRTKIQ